MFERDEEQETGEIKSIKVEIEWEYNKDTLDLTHQHIEDALNFYYADKNIIYSVDGIN
jgi:hypothetical protein